MNYESYVLEDDFTIRCNMIVPLIADEMVNQEWKKTDWKIFYDRYKEKYNHKDAKIASKNDLENMRKKAKELLILHINELINNLEVDNLLYYGDKYLKSKIFMLRYMIYLMNLEDRIMFYEAYINKKTINKKIIKHIYDDVKRCADLLND